MCGIVGYVGDRPAREVLLAGLEKLEYRGYDSAGISVLGADGEIESVRAVGNLAALRGALNGTGNGGCSASATRAGPRTGGSRSATPTRTTTAPDGCTSRST